MNFELAAPRPRLPAKKAALAKRTVGRRPSLANRREEKKLAKAADVINARQAWFVPGEILGGTSAE